MTNVPLLDLKAQYAQIRAEVMPVIEEVCASQRFILGDQVLALEAEVAALLRERSRHRRLFRHRCAAARA